MTSLNNSKPENLTKSRLVFEDFVEYVEWSEHFGNDNFLLVFLVDLDLVDMFL